MVCLLYFFQWSSQLPHLQYLSDVPLTLFTLIPIVEDLLAELSVTETFRAHATSPDSWDRRKSSDAGFAGEPRYFVQGGMCRPGLDRLYAHALGQ